MNVYRCIHDLLRSPELEATKRALDWWKWEALGLAPLPTGSELELHVGAGRRALYIFLHLPILALASAPAIGYVLSQNVPAGELLLLTTNYVTLVLWCHR